MVEPIYETLSGWQEKTYDVKKWEDLPLKAQNYVLFLEKLVQTNISVVSTGPERNQTIDRYNLLSNI